MRDATAGRGNAGKAGCLESEAGQDQGPGWRMLNWLVRRKTYFRFLLFVKEVIDYRCK